MRTVTRIIVEGSFMEANVNAVYSNDTNVTAHVHDKGTLEISDLKLTPEQTLSIEVVKNGSVEECGSCGSHHLKNFGGDCREDDNRFVDAG